MAKRIKLKDIIKEGIAGSLPSTLSTLGGVVTRKPFNTGISLANLVKEKFSGESIARRYMEIIDLEMSI